MEWTCVGMEPYVTMSVRPQPPLVKYGTSRSDLFLADPGAREVSFHPPHLTDSQDRLLPARLSQVAAVPRNADFFIKNASEVSKFKFRDK